MPLLYSLFFPSIEVFLIKKVYKIIILFSSANYCEIDGENCDQKSQVYKNIMFTDFQDFKIRQVGTTFY